MSSRTSESILPRPKTTELAPLAVSIDEAGRLLGVSARTAWQLCDDGKIRAFKVGTRKLVSVKEIQRFIDSETAGTGEGAK